MQRTMGRASFRVGSSMATISDKYGAKPVAQPLLIAPSARIAASQPAGAETKWHAPPNPTNNASGKLLESL